MRHEPLAALHPTVARGGRHREDERDPDDDEAPGLGDAVAEAGHAPEPQGTLRGELNECGIATGNSMANCDRESFGTFLRKTIGDWGDEAWVSLENHTPRDV